MISIKRKKSMLGFASAFPPLQLKSHFTFYSFRKQSSSQRRRKAETKSRRDSLVKTSLIRRYVKIAPLNASVSEARFHFPVFCRSSSSPETRAQFRGRYYPGASRNPAKCEGPALAGQNRTRSRRYACTLHRACGCSRTGRPDPQCARHSRRVRDESLSLLSLVPQDFRRFSVNLSCSSRTSTRTGDTRTRSTDERAILNLVDAFSSRFPRRISTEKREVAGSHREKISNTRDETERRKREKWRYRASKKPLDRSIDRPIDRRRSRYRQRDEKNKRAKERAARKVPNVRDIQVAHRCCRVVLSL